MEIFTICLLFVFVIVMSYYTIHKRKVLSFIFFVLALICIGGLIFMFFLPMKQYKSYEYINDKFISTNSMEVKFDQPMKIKVKQMHPFKYSSRYKNIYTISVIE